MLNNCQVCEIGSKEILEMAAEDKEERHEDQTSEWAQAWDDVTGQELIASEVQAARAKEMGYVKSMEVYAPATYAECIKNTGKPPIKSRWLDINKGDDANINYRSRWVAKQFKTYDDFEMFSATPPLDAIRYVVSVAASQKDGRLLAIDVSRAYFYAPARRLIYVELPDEAGEGQNICGRLLKSLYGTRDAAANWAAAYTSVMENMGFIAGHSNPCLFKHKSKHMATLVHGDDFLTAGSDDDLTWMHTEIAKTLEVKKR